MDKCIVLFVLLLVPYITMSQDYVTNLTSEGTIVTITSPNFPAFYDNDLDILRQVIAPTGFRVMVQFTDFKLGSGDSLSVYHGLTNSWTDAEFRTDLSGSSLPENISSIGSYLWLWFKTNRKWRWNGFSLMLSAVKPVIINLTSEETTMNITSPNYPENYLNNVDILWQVISPTGFRVMVQFINFDLGIDGTYYDSLRVYHGFTNSLEDATQRALLSGSSLPDNLLSIGSYLWLWFTTGGSVTEKGFSLSVRAVEPVIINLTSEERTMNITSPNYPENYLNNVDILWHVISPTGFRVMVQFNDFDLEQGDDGTYYYYYDILRVYHGLTNSLEDATQRARLSGSSLPDNISSIGSYLWLWFTSDGSVPETGFSLLVSAVESDWACDFEDDTCGLVINEGMWGIGEVNNYHYIRAIDDVASFTLNHAYTSRAGTLSFAHWQSGNSGSLTVTVCQDPFSYGNTFRVIEYEYITYLCDGTQDVQIMFTATRDPDSTSISVLDIQLFEASILSTTSTSTVIMNTRPLHTTTPESTQSEASSDGSGKTETTSTQILTSTNPSETTSSQGTLTQPTTSQRTSPTASPTTPPTTLSVTPPANPITTQPTTSKESTDSSLTISGTGAEASTVIPVGTTSNLAEDIRGGRSSAVTSAVCSLVVLIVIIMVIIAIFIYMRRRSRDPKVTEPVDQEDDDPNLYNNPVYCSKDDGLPIPDLIISTNSHTGNLSQARHPSTYMDNQYEEFEGDRHPVTNADGSASHNDALRDTTSESNTLNASPYYTLEDPSNQGGNSEVLDEGDYHTYEQAQGPQTSKKPGRINKGQTGTDDVYQELNNTPLSIGPYSSLASPNSGLPKTELQNGGKQGHSNGSAVLDDDEEYNALTFNQSSDITRAMKKPTSGGEGVNNGYGVLDLSEQKDSKLSVNSPHLHNDDVYNTLNEGPQEQQNGKQQAPDQSSRYQDLKLGQSNIPISHQGLNHKMGSTDDGSTGRYQSLSPGTKGPGPYERDQPVDESEYHSYQDPSEMNQDGSAHTPTEQDVFSSDKYNILNSGKEVGDYHVYQATDDADVDEGNYEDLDAKMSREDEYSEIGQSQNHAPGTTDKAPFEPIYSDEVYSEFQ